MQTLAFDGRTGASGDMILGALVAAGADPDALSPVEDALDVEYRIGETEKNGIRAVTVDVLVVDEGDQEVEGDGDEDRDDQHSHGPDHNHEHGHDHEHGHEQGHDHSDGSEHGDEREHGTGPGHGQDTDRDHQHEHAEGQGPLRTYPECREIVESMDLPAGVEADATAIFRLLGEAEARVHGTDLAETHFHEVGADDAIADVVGAALLVDDLGVDRVVTTPVAAGGGEVSMSHGVYPVPTPAVTYLAEEATWELRGGPVDTELLTPTGAAVLAHLAEGVDALPRIAIGGSGYGAGRTDLAAHPNVLRAIVGETGEGTADAAAGAAGTTGLRREEIRVLETNLDDATPEVLGGLQETLSAAGARDVVVLPATMKKSRPGHLVKVVVGPEAVDDVARTLAEETGTLGIREAAAGHRWIADRRVETVALDVDGETVEVDVKVATDADGAVYDVSAEFDDAARVAADVDLPVREVLRRAEAAARDD